MENRVLGFYESTLEQTGDAIKSQPALAVVVAVGLGVVAGMLVVGMFPAKQQEWKATQLGRQAWENLGKLTPSSWSS